MSHFSQAKSHFSKHQFVNAGLAPSKLSLVALLVLVPIAAHAQGSPFDNGFTALQTLFTGTVAKVASLIAIVIGGYLCVDSCPIKKDRCRRSDCGDAIV